MLLTVHYSVKTKVCRTCRTNHVGLHSLAIFRASLIDVLSCLVGAHKANCFYSRVITDEVHSCKNKQGKNDFSHRLQLHNGTQSICAQNFDKYMRIHYYYCTLKGYFSMPTQIFNNWAFSILKQLVDKLVRIFKAFKTKLRNCSTTSEIKGSTMQ